MDISKHPTGGNFKGKYLFGVFSGGVYTGGTGHSTLSADVTVCVGKSGDWSLTGTANFIDDKWDFDFSWWELIMEQEDKAQTWMSGTPTTQKVYDTSGRNTRAALGRMVPGKPFTIRMNTPMKISEKKGDLSATLSK